MSTDYIPPWQDPEWKDPYAPQERVAWIHDLSNKYHSDPEFRKQLDENPLEGLEEVGFELIPGIDVQITSDTHEVRHFVLPPDPNIELADEALGTIAAGSSAGSASSASSAGTLSSFLGTVSSASTAGSVGSASSAS